MEKNLAITQKVMILLTPEEFAEGMNLFLSKYQKTEKVPDLETEKMDRKQAAKFLGVSYPTMYLWVRDGVLKEHGLNRKKYFLRSELIEAMQNNS
jgi:excisionase family DNA binding protein